MNALTPKQQQVQDKLNQGKSVKQIAHDMRVTPNAVHGHIRKLKAKAEHTGQTVDVGPVTVGRNGHGSIAAVDALLAKARNTAVELGEEREKKIATIESHIEELKSQVAAAEDEATELRSEREKLDQRASQIDGMVPRDS